MTLPPHRSDLRHRIRQDLSLGQPLVRQLVHEARIRPILQQPPNKIRQQVPVPANRRIDPAMIAVLLHQPLVQPVAHPVQPLELEVARVARPFHDRRDRQRIVTRKRRPDILRGQHVLRHRQIRHVGRRLAREQRIVRQPLDLRALDLAVPIRALHQPHVHHAVQPVRPFDHRPRALAIGLHRHAEPVPALQRREPRDRADDVEAHLQALGLLRIYGQRDALRRRLHRQRLEHLGQRRHALAPPRHFVPWMQRRQLDRDRVPRRRIAPDRIDRTDIRLEVSLRIGVRPRRLAEHVEARGKALVLGAPHPLHRLVDGAAHHEDLAHHLHRRADRLPHERLARAADQAPQRPSRSLADQHATYHQPPGRRIDELRIRLARMRAPIRIAQLVRDQQIRGLGIGHAQERLRQRQQRDAFRRIEPIFLEELVHPALALRRAQVREQAQRMPHHPLARIRIERSAVQQRF